MIKEVQLVLMLIFGYATAFGQARFDRTKKPMIQINEISEKVTIDGKLDENCWKNATFYGNFIQHYPYDTSIAEVQTKFSLCNDEKYLYAAFICENRDNHKPFVVNNLKRDFSILTNDAVVLSLSPFLDGQNGFSFGVTPHNAQREGSIENGGLFGVSTAWDQVWFSETQISDSFWVAEMAIPLASIRYVVGAKTWGVNVNRFDLKNNEISSFHVVPRNFNPSALVFVDTAIWEKPLSKKYFNGVFLPYLSSNIIQLKTAGDWQQQPRIGFDAKVGITQSLNLDATLNPDFAQVDVDQQQVNLTRFNLFFPERRQFFIENSDLFANFGFRQIRPFFSRRIGLAPDRSNIPIQYGLRLSGKYGNQWRLGLMNVSTAAEGVPGANAINYSVLAIQRKVLKASNIGFILVHDERMGSENRDFNTVIGTEFNLLTSDNRWAGKGFIQKSHYPGLHAQHGFAHASWLMYKTLDWNIMWNHEYVSRLFHARTGFVPRVDNFDPSSGRIVKWDYWRLEPMVKRIFYPKKNGLINNYAFDIYNSSYYDSAWVPTESHTDFKGELNFQNSTKITWAVYHQYFRLFLPFAPVNLPGRGFLTGTHQWFGNIITLATNNRKPFSISGSYELGSYFIGSKQEFIADVAWRVPGWGKQKIPRLFISGNVRRIDIDFKDSGTYAINLIGLKADYSVTTTTYFIGYWQLNAQNKLMNINVRFQWRYRPMSDLFIVFAQNWDRTPLMLSPQTETWGFAGRSLAVKAAYWF
jgi:hypothetical protein